LNWLLLPHLGKRSVKGDSNFVLYLDIARVLAASGDFVHFVVDGDVEPNDLPDIPRVFYLILPALRGLSYYNRMALLPQQVIEECSRRSGTRFVDVVLTSRPMVVAPLKMALSAVDDAFVPVIYLEPGAEDRLQRIAGEDYRRTMAQAWQACDVCVVLTQRERDVVLAHSRRFFCGTEIQKLESRLFVNPVGVPTDSIDEVRDTPKNEKFTLFFGARAKEVKNIDQIVKLYDLIYRSGKDVRIVIATPTHERKVVELIGKERLDSNKDIQVFCGMGRSEYLKLAASSHVFVSMSRLEGFPVGFWEQLYLGLVGLFPKRPWALGQLPKEYPFFFGTVEEAFAQLSWVIDNYEEAKKKVFFMEALIREGYTKETVWGNLRSKAFELYSGHQYCMVKSFIPTLKDAIAALGDTFTFEEVIAFTSAQSKRMPLGSYARAEDFKYPGNFDFYRYILTLSFDYKLTGNGTQLTFLRKTPDVQEKE
jgi:glycosyltransferase involved in cell wall biosynthesis